MTTLEGNSSDPSSSPTTTPLSTVPSSPSSSVSSSLPTNVPALLANLKFIISNVTNLVPLNLDSSNFLFWKSLVHNVLCAYSLLCLVDGSLSPPPTTISTSDGRTIFNPDFLTWFSLDTKLVSFLRATISPSLLYLVHDLPHAFTVWAFLLKKFTTVSRSYLHKLKNTLSPIQRLKFSSMEEYLTQIKNLAKQLSIAFDPVFDEDLVYFTFLVCPPHMMLSNPSFVSPLKLKFELRDKFLEFKNLVEN